MPGDETGDASASTPDEFASAVAAVARKFALQNAVLQGRPAIPGAVTGKIMGEFADWRARAKEVGPIVARVVAEVNAMPEDARRTALEEAAPELLEKKQTEAKTHRLPDLPNAGKGSVIMRFAPNPSGPATFGHARGMTIHWQYKERYDAKLILRFDDTDPTVKRPMMEAYDWIPEDFEWLAGKPDEVIFASDRMTLYYEHARELLSLGGGYVCQCTAEDFRNLKNAGEPCPCRPLSTEENLALFTRMVDGEFAAGTAVVRIKTDITHKDPALRDWVGLRIVRDAHPRVGDVYKVWPLLDFQSAIDDHLTGVTHIIRGKDLRDSTMKQRFLYEHFGWAYPEALYWGRVSVHEFGKFSKSILIEAIARGEFEGWDDPRLPTLRALRRRGFQPDAIQNFWVAFGLSEKDIAASIKTLEAENRKVVEPKANRYFFVEDPVPMRVTGVDKLHGEAPLHPDHVESRGARVFDLAQVPGADGVDVLVPRADQAAMEPGARVRLKDLANLVLEGPDRGTFAGNDLDFLKREGGARIIHWAPTDGTKARLRLADGSYVAGIAEPALADAKVGDVVQLERVGFARVDARDDAHGTTLYFTHK